MLSEKAKAHLDLTMSGENNEDSREIAAAIDQALAGASGDIKSNGSVPFTANPAVDSTISFTGDFPAPDSVKMISDPQNRGTGTVIKVVQNGKAYVVQFSNHWKQMVRASNLQSA
jgi:hypothetical protein